MSYASYAQAYRAWFKYVKLRRYAAVLYNSKMRRLRMFGWVTKGYSNYKRRLAELDAAARKKITTLNRRTPKTTVRITYAQFYRLYRYMVIQLRFYSTLQAKAFKRCDLNHKGTVSKAEFMKTIKTFGFTAQKMVMAKKLATAFFKRTRGKVNRAQFYILYRGLMKIKHTNLAAQAFTKCDTSRGGMVDFREFYNCVARFNFYPKLDTSRGGALYYVRKHGVAWIKKYGKIYRGREKLGK
jgi:Ca2+-binding EF-hand superfamily protein